MTYIVVDVEADGPCPGPFSMVSFGAVNVSDLNDTFYGELAPISDKFIPEALAVSGISREKQKTFEEPKIVMARFDKWVRRFNKPRFITDNLAFDWQFINYYFHVFTGSNPFGYSGRRIGDIYSGLNKNLIKTVQWKRFRKTAHTHNPVDDAKGNAEAFIEMCKYYKLL